MIEDSVADPVRAPFVAPLALPEEMRARDQWVAWRLETHTSPGGQERCTKVLYDPRYPPSIKAHARVNDPNTSGTFGQAMAYAHAAPGTWGVGYVIEKSDPYVIVDIDDCVGDDGEIRPDVKAVVDEAGSFTEVSQSRRGVHIALRGTLAHLVPNYGVDNLHYGSRDAATGIEIYAGKRFIAMTGVQVDGTPNSIAHNQEWIDKFYVGTFAHRINAGRNGATANGANAPRMPRTQGEAPTPAQGPFNAISNDDLIVKALASTGKFAALWNDDEVVTTAGTLLGASEKRLALASLLTWWCGPDAHRIQEVIYNSPLYANYPNPDKFHRDLETYVLPMVIGDRLAAGEWYGSKTPVATDEDDALDTLLAEADRNDVGNRERFVSRHGQDVRYVPEQAAWYVYDAVRWASQIGDGAVQERSVLTVKAIKREADTIAVLLDGDGQDTNEKRRDALRAHAQASHARRKIIDLVALAQSHPSIAAKQTDFDQNLWLLNTQNGTLDLRTGVLRAHNRGDMLTQAIPVLYDPAAVCPQWERFMEGIQPDKEMREFLQRYLGYCLTGSTEDEVFIFLYGTGANGKSTLIETISALMGDLAAAMRAEVIATGATYAAEARFGIGCIVGRRLITVAELEERSSFNETRLKALTTGDSVDLEIKYKVPYTYKPRAKFILAGNYKPKIVGTDDGVWRRVALVNFEQQFTDDNQNPMLRKDRQLGKKLKAELPGILNWALVGLRAYLDRGLDLPEAVKIATDGYRADSDVLGQFLAECCVLKPGAVSNAKELYEAYNAWCADNGHRYVMPTNTFGSRLKFRGLEGKHTKYGNVWRGIGLAAAHDRSDDVPARREAAQDTVDVTSDQRIYGDL